jgi:hypothetical protein
MLKFHKRINSSHFYNGRTCLCFIDRKGREGENQHYNVCKDKINNCLATANYNTITLCEGMTTRTQDIQAERLWSCSQLIFDFLHKRICIHRFALKHPSRLRPHSFQMFQIMYEANWTVLVFWIFGRIWTQYLAPPPFTHIESSFFWQNCFW